MSDYQCVFIDAHDGTGECYQCGKTRAEHEQPLAGNENLIRAAIAKAEGRAQ